MQTPLPNWTLETLKLAVPATIVVLGWFAAHTLSTRRDDHTRRQQAVVAFRQRQIEELYGPLLSLIEQIFTIWTVRQHILASAKRTAGEGLSESDIGRIKNFLWRRYFLPLHGEIRTLLKNKQHLVEGGALPKSFEDYLEHSTQEEFQHLLWEELSIGTSFLPGRSWPQDFYGDVRAGLASVRASYEVALRKAEAGTSGGVFTG
jgi:hypothetical protein